MLRFTQHDNPYAELSFWVYMPFLSASEESEYFVVPAEAGIQKINDWIPDQVGDDEEVAKGTVENGCFV